MEEFLGKRDYTGAMAVLEFNRHSGQGSEEVLTIKKEVSPGTKIRALFNSRSTCGSVTALSTWATTNVRCLNMKLSHMQRPHLR